MQQGGGAAAIVQQQKKQGSSGGNGKQSSAAQKMEQRQGSDRDAAAARQQQTERSKAAAAAAAAAGDSLFNIIKESVAEWLHINPGYPTKLVEFNPVQTTIYNWCYLYQKQHLPPTFAATDSVRSSSSMSYA